MSTDRVTKEELLEMLDDYDKVRFGLPIEDKVREDVLKLRF